MAKKLGSSEAESSKPLNSASDDRRQQMSNVSGSTFLEAVAEISRVNAEARAVNERRKAIRKKWKAEGIELGILDATVKMAEWDRSEVRAFFDNGRRYAEWLGLPIGTQQDLFKGLSDDQIQAKEWYNVGRVASNTGKPGRPPEECPDEYHQDFMRGFNDEDERSWEAADASDQQLKAAAEIDPGKANNVADIAQALEKRGRKRKDAVADPRNEPDEIPGEKPTEGDEPAVLN